MFDFDDGVYLALLNPRQRDYLDEVPIVCRRNENIDSTWVVMLALIGAPLGVQSCCRSRAVHVCMYTCRADAHSLSLRALPFLSRSRACVLQRRSCL